MEILQWHRSSLLLLSNALGSFLPPRSWHDLQQVPKTPVEHRPVCPVSLPTAAEIPRWEDDVGNFQRHPAGKVQS